MMKTEVIHDLDFKAGLTWVAVILIKEQSHFRRRHVLFELACTSGHRLSVFLDESWNLMLEAVDPAGRSVDTDPIDPADILNRPLVLAWKIKISGNRTTISIAIPLMKYFQSKQDEIAFPETAHGILSMGGQADGHHPARFTFAELSIYKGSLSKRKVQQEAVHLSHKFGLRSSSSNSSPT